ncbi:adenosylcobinamide-phosphate synthase CbiB [Craterilacuibacter sp. RT1T]|uniref:adenosylcobinamide-phosphate synthase CbiB n=1 Tax=Craterilacuibacter sp. RT1T TaxID=2942211 RepID=UPI0020BF77A9|nr:adenosylcobinamide-phosphate synthase CbiB [Craterilacuibacter sp. RT1T]MCL6264188.1 adenosylcobinamide-phosphate synthase CbiB [Craterilacuibacter sp. RT1T]
MVTSVPLLVLAALMGLGLLLDLLLGEPRRFHPLAGFGRLAAALERRLNQGRACRARGLLAWALAVLPLLLLGVWLLALAHARWGAWAWLGHALLLYGALGLRSLRDHSAPIARALYGGDLAGARRMTSYIVSRDTQEASESDLAKAGVESLLENGSDAVFGTLFWFAIAGGPGALLFRLANTLDAMWGYRTPRFAAFGWAAARMDDVLGFIPARLTALTYALLGHTRCALRCWKTQAPGWPSPNAGPVMAAGAGALGLTLGGKARYDGEDEMRPPLGEGRHARATDLARAWALVAKGSVLWLLVFSLIAALATPELWP